MQITQSDIAHLTDNQVKALAVGMHDVGARQGGPLAEFWHAFALTLVAAMRERTRLVLLAEAELMDDDEEGELVEPGSDPVGDALAELRGERR